MSKRKRLSNEQILEIREEQSDTDSFSILSNVSDDLDSYSESSTSNEGEGEAREAISKDWISFAKARQLLFFTTDHGVKIVVEDSNLPVAFFEQYFDSEVFELITIETNRYERQFFSENENKVPSNLRFLKWVDTSPKEIKVHIALLTLQGIDSKSETQMYILQSVRAFVVIANSQMS